MIRSKAEKDLEKAIREATGEKAGEISLEHPDNLEHGDYASSWPLSQPGKDPFKLAQKIVEKFPKRDYLEKAEAMPPGFINLYLSPKWLIKELKKIIGKSNEYGQGNWGKGKRALVEYSSPNIAKDFSVGHLRSTIVGQAIRNLYDFSGWETIGDNHLGDWGTQFGMIIASIEEKNLDISLLTLSELEKIYVNYNKKARKDKKYLDKARDAFARLEKGDKKAKKIWEKAVRLSMKEFQKIYSLLGIKIENAYGESFYENLMRDVIKEMKKKGVAEKGEGGAWIVRYKDLPPAMLLKSDGTTTYFTRDMATIKFREENPKLKSEIYIYEVGAEQKLHFKQVFRAAEMMGWGKKENFVHIAHGLILGKDGKKLSTRKGTSEKLENWLTAIIKKAGKINPKTAKEVGVGAVKYSDLRHHPQKDYVFDINQALSLNGNSGPYIQYTYARTKSILRKTGKTSQQLKITEEKLRPEEIKLLRLLPRFPEIVAVAAKNFNPSLLCNYLFNSAKTFNIFYESLPVIKAQDETVKIFRLVLTQATAQVLKNGLNLLGIETPEKI